MDNKDIFSVSPRVNQIKSQAEADPESSIDNPLDKSSKPFLHSQIDLGIQVENDAEEDIQKIYDQKLLLTSKQRVDRMKIPIDQEAHFSQYETTKTAEQNMKNYMDSYGIEFQLPSLYVHDSRIYPTDPRYNLQLVSYVFPDTDDLNVTTHNLDRTLDEANFKQLFTHYQKGLVLRMLLRENSQLQKVDEIALNQNNALIKFHPDGTLFAFYFNDVQKLKICNVEKDKIHDFIKKMKDLENNSSEYFSTYDGDKYDLSFIEHLEFDYNKRFFCAYGQAQIFIQNFETKKGKVYPFNTRIYAQICDVKFASIDNTTYKCYVACKRQNVKQVSIFDLSEDLQMRKAQKTMFHGKKLESELTINFVQEVASTFQVMISPDFKQIVLANGQENCLIEQMEGYYNQKKLNQLKQKTVHHIAIDYQNGGFYFIACQDYDKYLSVEHSDRDEFAIRFARAIEPGIIKIFDFHVQQDISTPPGAGQRMEIRLVSLKDDEFLLDKAIYTDVMDQMIKLSCTEDQHVQEKQSVMVQKNIDYYYYIYSPVRAFSINWPYVSFTGLENFILLVDANDRKRIIRIQIAQPEEKISIIETFLSDTNDLFVVVQKQQMFLIYMIDLTSQDHLGQEDRQGFELQLILQYHEDQVDRQPLSKIHARGSSRKMKLDLNQKLQIFLTHGDHLYSWIQLNSNPSEQELKNQKVNRVCQISSTYYAKDDNSFYFLQIVKVKKKIISQEIRQIIVGQCRFVMKTIYKEQSSNERLKTFNMDQSQDKLIILTKATSTRGVTEKNYYEFKIFCLSIQEIIFSSVITFPKLIGRLKSGLFTFCNGHIYYNNNVIKVRYDLIFKDRSKNFTEHQIFDYYFDCFKLNEYERVKADTPLDSIQDHRFGYIISDQTARYPKKLILLPYLHERRIYLDICEENIDYFYTTIETELEEEKAYHRALKKFENNKSRYIKVDDIDSTFVKDKHADSKLKEFFVPDKLNFLNKPEEKSYTPNTSFTSILAINISENYYNVYSQNGIRINSINYKEFATRYGEPIDCSNSGQVYVFRKTHEQLVDLAEQGTPDEELLAAFMQISIAKFSVFGVQHIKDINILEKINHFIERQPKGSGYDEFINQNSWLTKSGYKKLSEIIDMKFVVNDKMDIIIRIRNNQGHNCYNTIYFYESNAFQSQAISKILPNSGNSMQHLIIAENNDDFNYIMNKKYMIMWDKKVIQLLELSGTFGIQDMFKADFQIDEQDEVSYIKEIRTGSNPDVIVIVVNQSDEVDTILSWNVSSNTENEALDIDEEYEIIWDRNGQPFIVTQSKIYFTNLRCALTSYDIGGALKESQKNSNSSLTFHKGHRVDGKNHNWCIFKEYLSLPFSYLSFVIKDKIEKGDELQKENLFDPDAYNYLFNKSTCFNEGLFVNYDVSQLESVLLNLQKTNLNHLEILNYSQEVHLEYQDKPVLSSAIVRAQKSGNNRSVDIILNALSHIDFNSSRSFKEIFPELIEQKNFIKYFSQLPVQTKQMEKKQVLRAPGQYNDTFISMTHSPYVYVDDLFYRTQMNEKPEYQSYPVKIVGLRVGWIMNEPEGKKFLSEILKSSNLELFDMESLQIIIEYLYQKFKILIFIGILPLYLFSHITYMMMVDYNSTYVEELMERFGSETDVNASQFQSQEKNDLLFWTILNQVAVFLQFAQVIAQMYIQKCSYFSRFYSYLDMIYLIQNFIQFSIIIQSYDKDFTQAEFRSSVELQRVLGVVGTITLYCKASYFLSLVDSISPLIDIIIQIIYDIKWFIVVMAIYILMLKECFLLLGRNQVNFDFNDYENSGVNIPYSQSQGAYWYVISMTMGSFDDTSFAVGDTPSQEVILKTVFLLAAFIINMHFMNMLIAIMGNTFAIRQEVASKVMLKDHLRFVIDNWLLIDIAFKNKKNVKYIITAFYSADGDEEDEDLVEIKDQLKEMNQSFQEAFKIQSSNTKDTLLLVGDLMKEFKKCNLDKDI